MPKGLPNLLDALETPLLFASKNKYSNLYKIKNLEEIVSDISLKLMSDEKNPEIKKHLNIIRKNFKDFDTLEKNNKIIIVNNTLDIIVKLKNKTKNENKKADFNNSSNLQNKKINELEINDPIRYIKGVGPRISDLLAKKGISTVEDLIFNFPRKYEDRRNVQTISAVKPNSKTIIVGTVLSNRQINSRKGKIFKVSITDGTGSVNLIWFKASKRYIENTFIKGVKVVVSGEVTFSQYDKSLQIIHPKPQDLEIVEDAEDIENTIHFNRIVPVYPLTEGLTQRRIRTIIRTVVENYVDKLVYSLPGELVKKCSLIELSEAIKEVHFPENYDNIVDLEDPDQVFGSIPHKTIVFFEFLMLELGLGLKKRNIVKKTGISFKNNGKISKQFIKQLPFNLTNAQLSVIEEIKDDMNEKTPMNRLVQGDVGSGKTVVSLISILNAVESSYQTVLMAPTEILCEQHYRSIVKYLKGFDINIVLLKSALSSPEKRKVNKAIKSGEAQIVLGTHALIEDCVEFFKLGLVVIDEQHRFGVMQRARLMDKAENPDVLVLTATPIPRTLAITVYGDLDISLIDELPPGRKEITTLKYNDNEKNRSQIYDLVRTELDKGRQGYVICPFIEESESPEFKHIKYVGSVFDILKNNVFSDFNIGLLHGQMGSEEKDEVMTKFIENQINLLVSTTVIEVGVDVQNATFMVIENSERYGLSQLHQLRGRIGRSDLESFCILISDYAKSEGAEKKLNIMTKTNDGFKIAEADLQIRGPGDFLGTKQSGIPQFKFANLIRDWKLLYEARERAFEIISIDPDLDDFKELRNYIKSKWGEMLGFQLIS
ncbi:MAG: ATP-dependent DNA helicase RecG [Thermodesulfobacteriota bacterium]